MTGVVVGFWSSRRGQNNRVVGFWLSQNDEDICHCSWLIVYLGREKRSFTAFRPSTMLRLEEMTGEGVQDDNMDSGQARMTRFE
jgi:hypothetical protein